jgi:hypothetical protein
MFSNLSSPSVPGLTHLHLGVLAIFAIPQAVSGETIFDERYDNLVAPSAILEPFTAFGGNAPLVIDRPVTSGFATFASHFHGQSLVDRQIGTTRFDLITGAPRNPLALQMDPAGQNLFWAYEDDAASLALQGIGPAGAGRRDGIGEGSIAVLFDRPVCSVGFQTVLEGMLPPGTTGFAERGSVQVSFFSAEGKLLGQRGIDGTGGVSVAYGTETGLPPQISGILIESVDDGGIFVDNLKYAFNCELQVS